jgi:hypothetical protein
MPRIQNGWSLLLCVEKMAVTVVQQNDERLTEQEKKNARFAERLPPNNSRPPFKAMTKKHKTCHSF